MDAGDPSSRKNSSEAAAQMVGPSSHGAIVPNGSMAMLGSRVALTIPGMLLDFNQTAPPALRIRQGNVVNTGELRKKRGRPRKYGSANATPPLPPVSSAFPSWYSIPNAARRRSRRPRPWKRQQPEDLGSVETAFTSHVIIVGTGEDVTSTITAMPQQGPRTFCILAGNGAVSKVTLRQPARSGMTVTYELVMGSFIVESQRVRDFRATRTSSRDSEETLSDLDYGGPRSSLMNRCTGDDNDNSLGQRFHTDPAYCSVGGCPPVQA